MANSFKFALYLIAATCTYGVEIGVGVGALTEPTPTATPLATPITTPVATATPTPTPVAATTPLTSSSPPPQLALPPPPPTSHPPPPPGTGSDKTAVLSIISLTGAGLLPFNVSKGGGFQAALGRVLGVPGGSILIRDWSSGSRRRLLADTAAVTSAAVFGDGVAAAAGLNSLKAADQSGKLQAAFVAEGLSVESAAVQSATTALPSNFQPLLPAAGRGKLSLTAIILIAIAGAVVLGLFAFCCCRRCFWCCPLSEEEERLPNMIKFGFKDGSVPFFYNAQAFKKSAGLAAAKPLPDGAVIELSAHDDDKRSTSKV